ncbi:MAG: response regulator [Pirellulaceae bacterium]
MDSERPVASILIVDDDPHLPTVVSSLFEQQEARVRSVGLASAVAAAISEQVPHVVLLDYLLPDAAGLDVLEQLRRDFPRLPIIFLTSGTTGVTTSQAMKLGAFDCLNKPLQYGQLRQSIEGACTHRIVFESPRVHHESVGDARTFPLVGQSEAMRRIFKQIGRLCNDHQPILIVGEPGTGKEAIARTIHAAGGGAVDSFVAEDAPTLAEAHLHELFSSDEISTLYLANVDLAEARIQFLLCRYLQSASSSRYVGRRVRCRVIVSCDRELSHSLAKGMVRRDLYYTVASNTIEVPPIRSRRVDVPLLVQHVVNSISMQLGYGPATVPDDVMQVLMAYSWPGNVDEMICIVHRCLAESGGCVSAEMLASELAFAKHVLRVRPDESGPEIVTNWNQFVGQRLIAECEDVYEQAITETENHVLRIVLTHTSGNQAHASRILGMTRASLRKKLRLLRWDPKAL